VALLQGPGTMDVAALARQAVADGADLLGVAGGDGTQALWGSITLRALIWKSSNSPAHAHRG